jgi:hypothetical protein
MLLRTVRSHAGRVVSSAAERTGARRLPGPAPVQPPTIPCVEGHEHLVLRSARTAPVVLARVPWP